MNPIHEHLWKYLNAKRAASSLKEWLRIANIMLQRNGLEPQSDALDAQRLLKTIPHDYPSFL